MSCYAEIKKKEAKRYDGIKTEFNSMRDFYKESARGLVRNLLFTDAYFTKDPFSMGLEESKLVAQAAKQTCGKDTWGVVKDSKIAVIGAALSLVGDKSAKVDVVINSRTSERHRLYRLSETAMKEEVSNLHRLTGNMHLIR
ncbi:MAG TPA: hypothetical protein VND15_01500 [Candidatus Acidoferrales bacterium]|nr:hypothetical protein [Candidatus Acidoferrales bacterium]